jgi:hypothetical protein
MASDDQAQPSSAEPQECMPCRGTGKVISNLDGRTSTVTCPWCRGGGVRLTGIDAQAIWLDDEERPGAAGAAEGSDGEPPDQAA